jgi:RimJ/RimL family protein N-acetyltransferase
MTKTTGLTQPEVGLFWAIDPDYQKQGYATEAAMGFLKMIWNELKIKRIIATTEYDNYQSQRVMQKIGMKILKNNSSEPPWLQVVGVINHPDLD